MSSKPQIILTLEALPVEGVPLAIRVRTILKRLLRDYRFRCVQIAGDALAGDEATIAPPASPDAADAKGRPL